MSAQSNKEVIEGFYRAFVSLDGEEMAKAYHDEVVFEDPAFGELRGLHAGNMWKMLCASQKGKEFKVSFQDITANDTSGSAHWEADYIFSQTGRKIHNEIEAHFEFKDGKIIRHIDNFDLHKWAKQALGLKGTLLGGTQFFRKKLQAQTKGMLDKFESRMST